jgi:small subunit ribosomal protein S13
MARIAGVDLPREKRVDVALRYIYGVGPTRSSAIVDGTQVNPGTKVRDLSEEEVSRIREYIDRNYKVEGDLRRDVAQDIKRKIEIASYQGIRHRRSLPVRGQRTHTNARTRKGPKKTVGVKRKKGK